MLSAVSNLTQVQQEVACPTAQTESLSFVPQSNIEDAFALVSHIDLAKLNAKLHSHYGWDKYEVENIGCFYKEWLVLHICYPNVSLVPNARLDEYWHAHILDTIAYTQDCLMLFGKYLHHYPYYGLEGDEEQKEQSFELTNKLYQHHFNHRLNNTLNPCKSTDCR